MISYISSGGTVTSYSSRFTLSGMTGAFPAAIQSALSSIAGTTGPPRSRDPARGRGGSAVSAAQAMDVAPALQGGPTVYESMQPLPPTSITRTSRSAQYPTSPYWLATTFLPPNSDVSRTVVQSGTWSFAQRENPVGLGLERDVRDCD